MQTEGLSGGKTQQCGPKAPLANLYQELLASGFQRLCTLVKLISPVQEPAAARDQYCTSLIGLDFRLLSLLPFAPREGARDLI